MNELIIFAGGLGSRLNGTEAMPKPLVPINGLAMLTIVIKEFEKTNTFNKYHILISENEDLYVKWKNKEMEGLDIRIVNENKRSGRTGALKNFLKVTSQDDKSKKYALSNGDTIIEGINDRDIEQCIKLNTKGKVPVVLLVAGDDERKDARAIEIGNKYYFNSGFLVTERSWLEHIVSVDAKKDIDEHIFKKDKYETIISESSIVDIGTPDRLKKFREDSE